MHAEILFLLGDAQLTKATASAFDKAREDALEAAAETLREATKIYRQLEDSRWIGQSLLGTALALVGLEDEELQMDGEWLAEEAKDLFHEAGERALEVVAMLTIVRCRCRTSGSDCAMLSAKDAAEDWKEEGGRPADVAIALSTAACLHLQQQEGLDEAVKLCEEAAALFKSVKWRRAESIVLQNLGRAQTKLQRFQESLVAIKEAVAIFNEVKDRKAEGEALAYLSEALWSKLNSPEGARLSAEDAKALAAEAEKAGDDAKSILEELGDKEGLALLEEVFYEASRVAVEAFCESNPPARVITNLKPDGHGAAETVGEWKIPRGEGQEPLCVRRPMDQKGQKSKREGYV